MAAAALEPQGLAELPRSISCSARHLAETGMNFNQGPGGHHMGRDSVRQPLSSMSRFIANSLAAVCVEGDVRKELKTASDSGTGCGLSQMCLLKTSHL